MGGVSPTYQEAGAGLGSFTDRPSDQRPELLELSQQRPEEQPHSQEQLRRSHSRDQLINAHVVFLQLLHRPLQLLVLRRAGGGPGHAKGGTLAPRHGGNPGNARRSSPALQPVDVLLPPPPAVLGRLLVADFPPNFLQDSLLGLETEAGELSYY